MHCMLHTRCLHRVTWLPTLCTWLALGATYMYLVFLRLWRIEAFYCEFWARIFMNARFIPLSASVFSRNRACVSLHLRATSTTYHLNRALSLVNFWIPGVWLSADILHRAYSALDTLFFLFIIYSCLLLVSCRASLGWVRAEKARADETRKAIDRDCMKHWHRHKWLRQS